MDLVTALLMDFTVRFDAEELLDEGQKRDPVFIPVNDVTDLLQDSQLEASHLWSELDHPGLGCLKYPLGVLDSEEVSSATAPAPQLGQDNRAVYCRELGLSDDDLVALRAAGVI